MPVLIGRVLDPQIRLRVTGVRIGFGTDGGLAGRFADMGVVKAGPTGPAPAAGN